MISKVKDLGFGLFDTRTITIFLIVFVLSNTILGNSIPLNTSDARIFFIDLVLITGYIYAGRSLVRFPIAIIVALLIAPNRAVALLPELEVFSKLSEKEGKPQSITKTKKLLWRVKGILVLSLLFIYIIILTILQLPFLIFTFDTWTNNTGSMIRIFYPSWMRFGLFLNTTRKKLVFLIFGILDRLGVVLIAYFATLPDKINFVKSLGIIGLVLITLLYVIRGSFSGLAPDAIKDTNET